jgi:riboflavin biosynthesis pyrimidine reductase
MIGPVRRILPVPGPGDDGSVDLEMLYQVPRERVGDRPWVGLCMIASLDGSTVVAGRSGGLGNATDSRVLGALRRAADVVLVGARTVRAEGYGPPTQPALRIGVVTARGVDTDTELFASGAGFLVLPDDGPPAPAGIAVVRAGQGRVDVGVAVRRLGTVVETPRFVQCEGGPHLNGSLLAADLVDELDLTVSPVLVGGDGPRPTSAAPPTFERFDLAHLATDDGYLYGRWVRRDVRPAPPS